MEMKRALVLESLVPVVFVLLVLNIYSGRVGFLYTAIALLAMMLFVKSLAAIFAVCWLKLGEMLGAINAKVMLTVIFFLFLTPIAILFRLFNKNPLRLKAARELTSYYSEQDHLYTQDDLKKMW